MAPPGWAPELEEDRAEAPTDHPGAPPGYAPEPTAAGYPPGPPGFPDAVTLAQPYRESPRSPAVPPPFCDPALEATAFEEQARGGPPPVPEPIRPVAPEPPRAPGHDPPPTAPTPGSGLGAPPRSPGLSAGQPPAMPPRFQQTAAAEPLPHPGAGMPPRPGGPPPLPKSSQHLEPGKDEGPRRLLAGFLYSFQEDSYGRHWVLHEGDNLVGRAETSTRCDVPIAHGTTSTRHATIRCDDGQAVLIDMKSTNGTYLNGRRLDVNVPTPVNDGDKIRFGGYTVYACLARQRG